MAKHMHSKAAAKRNRENKIVAAVMGGALLIGIGAGAGLISRTPAASITVITTAKTVKETDVAVTSRPADLIRDAADSNGRLDLIKVDGDGTAAVKSLDLTPRDSNGREVKPLQRRQNAITTSIANLEQTMNEFVTSKPGRSVLAGLQNVPTGGSGPILVYSPLLDTMDPLSMISLGFDVDPNSVVKQLKATNEMPAHLKGRDIIFVVTPVAGDQAAPRQPQVMYVQNLLSAIVGAAGAGSVTFVVGQGGLPAGRGGDAPVIPIPAPPGTIKAATKTTRDSDGTTKVKTQCVIPSPQFFEPDRDILLDKEGAKAALANCVRQATAKTTVLVAGHTACRNAPDSDPVYAKKLSEDRARRVGDIVVDLGVVRRNITIRGWGDTKPLVKPCIDPANRATVVTITTPKESK